MRLYRGSFVMMVNKFLIKKCAIFKMWMSVCVNEHISGKI